MALIDEIVRLRDESLAALDASHNYFAHTKSAWRLVRHMARKGRKFQVRNQITDSTIDQTELAALARIYVSGYLSSATFQDFVAVFERFFFDFLIAWLSAYPASLSGKELKFRTVLNAPDKNQIIHDVVRREVQDLAYQRVSDWFAYLEKIAQLGCPTAEQIDRLAEIKASRDVLVHNNGLVNDTYLNKSKQAARYALRDKLELPEHYHRESWQLIKQVDFDIASAGIAKLRH